jgi:hypothetical protein
MFRLEDSQHTGSQIMQITLTQCPRASKSGQVRRDHPILFCQCWDHVPPRIGLVTIAVNQHHDRPSNRIRIRASVIKEQTVWLEPAGERFECGMGRECITVNHAFSLRVQPQFGTKLEWETRFAVSRPSSVHRKRPQDAFANRGEWEKHQRF